MNAGQTVGLLGGGQLGRMLSEAASRLNAPLRILDQPDDLLSPAKMVTPGPHHKGSFADADAVRKLAAEVSVVTIEIEHVDARVLKSVVLEAGGRLKAYPGPDLIAVVQDKYAQKVFLEFSDLPLPQYVAVEPAPIPPGATRSPTPEEEWSEQLDAAARRFGWPLVLKARKMAYDGRGNAVAADLKTACREAVRLHKASDGGGIYVEKLVPFVRELACVVARSRDGRAVVSYPVVETVHRNGVCHVVMCPAEGVDDGVRQKAQRIAERAVVALGKKDTDASGVGYDGAVGVFGVEMFHLKDDTILINEIAPRPHNSGHYTIEACLTSQYENHLRAVLGLPLGSPDLKVGAALMVNLLGAPDSSIESTLRPAAAALSVPGASIHLYGKKACRPGRKMGHITVTGNTKQQCMHRAKPILEAVDASTGWNGRADAERCERFGRAPLVGIIMGSDSDLPRMRLAAQVLTDFDVPFELTIVSAHRTPDRMVQYARSAHERGLKVIIAGAGGAAHLPGMIAAITPLPVVGVPMKLSTLDGVDSLYSIVQMPRGVPVATVAIDNSTNAGLLAVRILGSHLPAYQAKIVEHQKQMEREVQSKVDRLAEVSWRLYGV
ncbi:MAG: AIR carboxylase-domain-containing protein [Olpidium bornovanus]|uniref:Phosphoribosylaminoimidazole carboxylase n=1 Tax=Olpidium bornovanus TaxID=278681 RepID=A0A8H7ZWD9_9FUNG|nr:MAG: AIR carboxylase-domain-containing protein [Olpidium bornovanus]